MAQLNGAPYKLEAVVNFHVGDTITGLARTALQPGGIEARARTLPPRLLLPGAESARRVRSRRFCAVPEEDTH